MRFSRTELAVLKQIADGNRNIQKIAIAMKKSKVQIYRSGQKLIEKGFIERSNGFYEPLKTTLAGSLVQLLGKFPSAAKPFSDSGIDVLMTLFEPKSIKQIMQESGMKKTQVFKKIKQARSISMLRKLDDNYVLNAKLWSEAINFLKELKKHNETIDPRVPANSIIYYKNDKEIIFSNKEYLDASLTAFSAYEYYGIKLLTVTHFYYLPKKKLSREEIFVHSIFIAEKDQEIRHIIFVALFYLKYKRNLLGIKHLLLEKINKILEGERIDKYPTLGEIRDRADVYDIKV